MAGVKSDDNYCFGCGRANPIGLHLDFSEQGGKYTAHKKVDKEYQGYDDIVHGGILSTMMDEAMGGYLLHVMGTRAVTARLNVRYRHPTPVGVELTISGWVESRKNNIVMMKSAVSMPDGTVTAEASARMAIVEQAQ